MKNDLFPVVWEREAKPKPPEKVVGLPRAADRTPHFLIAPGLVGVALLLIGGYIIGGRSDPPPRPTQEPSSYSYAEQIEDLRRLIAQGKIEAALAWADLYLSDEQKKPSSEARAALVALRYRAAIATALASPDRQDPDGANKVIKRLQDAQEKAASQGLPAAERASAMSLFGEAMDRSLWEVARHFFLVAWEEGLVRSNDIGAIHRYYAALRNWAGELIRTDRREDKTEGLAVLSTAEAINRAYALRRGEAYLDLVEQLGRDEGGWPGPLPDDPVLRAKRPE
jgi:hypothetical protein